MSELENDATDIQTSTRVEETEIDIDALFGMPGADNIMLPESGEAPEKKPSIFSKKNVDTKFLDRDDLRPPEKVETVPASTEDPIGETEPKAGDDDINELNELINDEEGKGNAGRPRLEKDALLDLTSKMIEEGTLMPFEDDKALDDYSVKDFRELLEANFSDRESKFKESMPSEFFNSLPEELQIAAKYVADGGTDIKGMFRTLSQVSEVLDLDMSNDAHHSEITRQYLHATRFGTAEEIEEQISEWEDLGKLDTKAGQFKPKLDKMQESIVAGKLADQEQKKKQQEHASQQYMDNVYDTLIAGELGDIKLDKKTQEMLYSGLVQPNYPSISGKPTNLLGHLLEKYQFVEPRHDLIAEALWLLQDPDGYKTRIKEQGGKAATEKTVRMLKTEESKKTVSSAPTEDNTRRKAPRRTLSREQSGFFKR
jgi:hypothetical protein